MDSNAAGRKSSDPGLTPAVVLSLIIVIYIIIFLYLEYQRYLFLEIEETGDTASNIQTLWSVVHGQFFTTTVHDYLKPVPHNVLGDQLYFTLLLYLPFWLVFPNPFIFVVVTVVASALGAVPLFFLAKDRLQSPWWGVFLGASYLFNWMSWGTYFRFGFRAETLVIPFLFSAWFFIQRGKYLRAFPFLVLTLFTKHDSILIMVFIGLYLLFQGTQARRFGFLCVVLGIGYYFAAVKPLFDHFSYSATAHFKGLDEFGASPLSVVLNLFSHPGLFLDQITPVKLKFLARTLFPVGYLCLFSPAFYMALPIILINLLLPDYLSVYCGWHWALVVPFVYLGAVDTLAWLKPRWPARFSGAALAGAVLLAAFVFLVEASWVMDAFKAEQSFYYRQHRVDTRKMIQALKVIEPQASVSTMYRMTWFLAARKQVYINHYHLHLDTDYVVVTLPLKIAGQRDLDRRLIPMIEDPESPLNKNFVAVVKESNIIIYKKLPKIEISPNNVEN